MAESDSNMRLHLQYRLWIADMNADITVLRIFDDYFAELSSRKPDTQTQKTLEGFKQKFSSSRKEIDELKHEMHLEKMKLAANLRTAASEKVPATTSNNHPGLEKRYIAFRKNFDKLKKDLVDFKSA